VFFLDRSIGDRDLDQSIGRNEIIARNESANEKFSSKKKKPEALLVVGDDANDQNLLQKGAL